MRNRKKSTKIILWLLAIGAAVIAYGCRILNRREELDSEYSDEKTNRNLSSKATIYEKYIKRGFDIIVGLVGTVIAVPICAIVGLCIYAEDPGNVIFKQKRVGVNKSHFNIHKLRSMRQSTGDIPTHLLDKKTQDNMILKVGRFIRKTSIDELPQFIDILRGRMSLVGPRPALWNQYDLVAERDKYQANQVRPGLTGLAQIRGRDELTIEDKAKYDGEYCKALRTSSLAGFIMDVRCLIGTIKSVLHADGVVEGGTGMLQEKATESIACRHYTDGKNDEDLIGHIGFGEPVQVDVSAHKKVLITGAGSYIGDSFIAYAREHHPKNYAIDAIDMIDGTWREKDFSAYDIVYHVAGIAHADVGHVDDATKEKYYAVNTDLAVEVCKKAKAAGVKEYIFMSSMIVYGDSAPYGKQKVVDEHTVPKPANFYGDSKLQADVAVRALADDNFKVIVLRPPMIYGKGSKGNYPTLAKLAKKFPIFPDVDNQRSMLHIDNLCEFLCQVMLVKKVKENAIVLIPQNAEWTKTADMVKEIAAVSGKKMKLLRILRPAVLFGGKMPGKIGGLVNKAFGNSCYAHEVSRYSGIRYQRTSTRKSIIKTEGRENSDEEGDSSTTKGKHILVVSQYFYPETFRVNDMCQEWVKRGYKVTVVTGIPNYPMGETYDGYGLTKNRHEFWNGVEIYRIPLIPRGSSSIGMLLNYISFMISGMLAGKFMNIKADYVFSFEVSPMTQVLTGISFAKKLGVPHYLYVQDLWPENVMAVTGITNPMIIKPIDKMVDYIYKHADEIFVTSPSFVKAICNRKIPVNRKKVHYWPQYAEEFYQPCERKVVTEIPDDGSFKIIFTGNIGTAQGLQILPKTAERLKEENVKFVVIGDGRYLEEFNKEVEKLGVTEKFVMIPRQPAERIPELLAACDAAFLSFQDTKLWSMTIPAKLQSYMACGMPIIAAARGETKRIIDEAQCGVCSAIGDPDGLSMKIKNMMVADLVSLGKASRDYFETHFDKQMLMNQMEKYLI